jgi:hypothetical protein
LREDGSINRGSARSACTSPISSPASCDTRAPVTAASSTNKANSALIQDTWLGPTLNTGGIGALYNLTMDPYEKYDMIFNGAVATRSTTTSPGRYAGMDNGWALSLLQPVIIEFDKSIVESVSRVGRPTIKFRTFRTRRTPCPTWISRSRCEPKGAWRTDLDEYRYNS